MCLPSIPVAACAINTHSLNTVNLHALSSAGMQCILAICVLSPLYICAVRSSSYARCTSLLRTLYFVCIYFCAISPAPIYCMLSTCVLYPLPASAVYPLLYVSFLLLLDEFIFLKELEACSKLALPSSMTVHPRNSLLVACKRLGLPNPKP